MASGDKAASDYYSKAMSTRRTPRKATKRAKKEAAEEPQPLGNSNGICFTIMPFGGWFDSYFESIYKPAIEAAGLTPRRADDLYRPSAIVHDIWALTKAAKLLLADLTGKNPNVFYELGLAHAVAKPVVLVAESMDDVPFDLRALRVIVYNRNRPDWGEALARDITTSITEVISSPNDAVLPTFLNVVERRTQTITEEEKEIISVRQDLDFVKRELAAQNEFLSKLRVKDQPVFPPSPPSVPDRSAINERVYELLQRGVPTDVIYKSFQDSGFSKLAVDGAIARARILLTKQ
jgi:hypothetical protein